MTKVSINIKKLDKGAMYVGEKGTYLTLFLIKNKGGKDRYGNDGFVAQEPSKEQRKAGEKGPIVGNWKLVESKQHTSSSNDDDIPF